MDTAEFPARPSALMATSATLMLVLNVFVFVPFEIYQGSSEEFEVGFLQIGVSYWTAILALWMLILLPLVLPAAAARRYCVLVFVLALYSWMQSTLFMWDYGVVDGRGLDFGSFNFFGIADLLILLGLVIAALLFSSKIAPHVSTVACLFVIGQSSLMLYNAMGRENIWERPLVRLEIPEAFSALSRQQNIIHIILDSAQSDVFLELIDEADLRSNFSGFTLYRENAAVAPHTAFGVPSTFSGKLYDGSQSPESFFSDSIQNGFHSQLHQAGYVVNLIPLLSMESGPHTNYFKIPSGYSGTNEDLIRANARKLMDVALFRVFPHFLRVEVYDEGNWFLSSFNSSESDVNSFRQKMFFRDYIDGLAVGLDDPVYNFLHLMPPHPPYVTLEDGSYAGRVLPNTRANYLNEMRPMVVLVNRLIERLKSLGVYNDAGIVIHGDHGSSVGTVVDGQSVTPCLLRLPALLAVKPPEKNGPLKVSSSKTSLLDIAPTMLNMAGHKIPGVFELDSTAPRRRHYFMYDDNRITNYWIDGSVYDTNSCKRAGARNIEFVDKTYEIGTTLKFGMHGNAEGVAQYGWGPGVRGYVWSKSKRAALKVQLGEHHPNTDLILALTYRPYVRKEKLPEQRIILSVNGVVVDEWFEHRSRSKSREVRIPADTVKGSEVNIVFDFPDAASPRSLGLGADRKKLGIALMSVRLSVAPHSD